MYSLATLWKKTAAKKTRVRSSRCCIERIDCGLGNKTPQLQTTQPNFSSDFTLSVIPSVTMKLNDIFTFTMTATPIADLSDLKVAGDLSTKSVCANSTVSLNVHSHSELHFDVDWLHIHDDKTWDKDIYSSGNVDLEEKCIQI